MINIRPVSDLRNHFSEIEATVKEGVPIYLTKHGHGAMVVMSIEQYEAREEQIEDLLDASQCQAAKEEYEKDPTIFTLSEVEDELGL